MSTLSNFQRRSIAATLNRRSRSNRALTADTFSVCTVRTCARAAGIEVHTDPSFQTLRLWNAVPLDDTLRSRADVQIATLMLFDTVLDLSDGMDGLARQAGYESPPAPHLHRFTRYRILDPIVVSPPLAKTAPAHSGDSLPRNGDGALVPVPAPHRRSHIPA